MRIFGFVVFYNFFSWQLSEISGISGCVFVHSGGFIGGNKTKVCIINKFDNAKCYGFCKRRNFSLSF